MDSSGFGRFYKPLEERRKQLEESLPKIQAEIDLCKVNNLSAEQVASEVQDPYQHWPGLEPEAKRAIVEAITEKIVISKDEISITLCYLPLSGDMAKSLAEGEGFEPSVQALIPYSGLANRRFRPLSHPSAAIAAPTYQTPPTVAIRLSRPTNMARVTPIGCATHGKLVFAATHPRQWWTLNPFLLPARLNMGGTLPSRLPQWLRILKTNPPKFLAISVATNLFIGAYIKNAVTKRWVRFAETHVFKVLPVSPWPC